MTALQSVHMCLVNSATEQDYKQETRKVQVAFSV